MSDTSTARCPACDGPVRLGPTVIVSELLKCAECGTDLEVTSIAPAAVAEAPMDEEDWGQ